MPETQSRISPQFESSFSRPVWIEPLLGFALGTFGGLLQGMVLRTSLLSGGLLGAAFGLAFGLFFARRATSPGAGLIWGLGSSFLLWILTAGGVLHLASGARHSAMMFQDAQAHFSELVAYVLCLWNACRGSDWGTGGGFRASSPDKRFAWGRAIVAGGFAGTLGGLSFGRWVSSGNSLSFP